MRVCVIGASTGIGQALARELERRGHEVRAVSRSTEPAVDVTDGASLRAWKKQMDVAGWSPDAVVLNAAVLFEDLEADGYDHERGRATLATNLNGALLCVEAFLPDFLKRGNGSLVAVSSTSAVRPSPRSAAYSASKAGLAMAFRSLRLRYRGRGVRFGLVHLGPVATGMWEGKPGGLVPAPEAAARAIADFVASGRENLWYPRLSTALLRLSLWLPDSAFAKATAWMRR